MKYNYKFAAQSGICPVTGKEQTLEIEYREEHRPGETEPFYRRCFFKCPVIFEGNGADCNACPIFRAAPCERTKL